MSNSRTAMVKAIPRQTCRDEPPSPCVSLCRLDRNGYCEGCLRTATEIELWPEMDPGRRWSLLEELQRRRAAADFERAG